MENGRSLDGLEVGHEGRCVEGTHLQDSRRKHSVLVQELYGPNKEGNEEIGREGDEAGKLVSAVVGVHVVVGHDGGVHLVTYFCYGFLAGKVDFDGGVCGIGAEAFLHHERHLYGVAVIYAAVHDETVDAGEQARKAHYSGNHYVHIVVR